MLSDFRKMGSSASEGLHWRFVQHKVVKICAGSLNQSGWSHKPINWANVQPAAGVHAPGHANIPLNSFCSIQVFETGGNILTTGGTAGKKNRWSASVKLFFFSLFEGLVVF